MRGKKYQLYPKLKYYKCTDIQSIHCISVHLVQLMPIVMHVHELRTSLHYKITTLMLTWMDLAKKVFLVMQHILYGCNHTLTIY